MCCKLIINLVCKFLHLLWLINRRLRLGWQWKIWDWLRIQSLWSYAKEMQTTRAAIRLSRKVISATTLPHTLLGELRMLPQTLVSWEGDTLSALPTQLGANSPSRFSVSRKWQPYHWTASLVDPREEILHDEASSTIWQPVTIHSTCLQIKPAEVCWVIHSKNTHNIIDMLVVMVI